MRSSSWVVIGFGILVGACSIAGDPSESAGEENRTGARGDESSSVGSSGTSGTTGSSGATASSSGTTSSGTTSSGTTSSGATSSGASVTPADPGAKPTQTLSVKADGNGIYHLTAPQVDYWMRLPKGYSFTAPTAAPILIGFHGCGDTALNFLTWGLSPADVKNSQTYIAVSVGGAENGCWDVSTQGAYAQQVLAHVRQYIWVHQKKVFLGGFSSGGQLAYKVGMTDASSYAGILIENSGLYAAVGANQVTTTLSSAEWKINVAHAANSDDSVFPLSKVQSDFNAMKQLGFPATLVVGAGTHDGTSDRWTKDLLPHMNEWVSP